MLYFILFKLFLNFILSVSTPGRAFSLSWAFAIYRW